MKKSHNSHQILVQCQCPAGAASQKVVAKSVARSGRLTWLLLTTYHGQQLKFQIRLRRSVMFLASCQRTSSCSFHLQPLEMFQIVLTVVTLRVTGALARLELNIHQLTITTVSRHWPEFHLWFVWQRERDHVHTLSQFNDAHARTHTHIKQGHWNASPLSLEQPLPGQTGLSE